MFEEQPQRLASEYKGDREYLSVHQPDYPDAHDDFPDSMSLMLMKAAMRKDRRDFSGEGECMAKWGSNIDWNKLKEAVRWGGRRSKFELLLATVVLPIVEGALINLMTDSSRTDVYIPTACLIVVGGFHFVLALMILISEQAFPLDTMVRNIEAEERAEDLERELNRRTDSYRMIRGAVEQFNRQSCFSVASPWCENGYQHEFLPVVSHFTQNIRSTMGVTNAIYTIEVHLKPEQLEAYEAPWPTHNNLVMPFFFSPQQITAAGPRGLGANSPARLGIAKGVAGIHRISDDVGLFYENGQVKNGVYFRSYATVPIREVCSENAIGILVLTSMQEEAFSEDILDTLQFLAALVANFTSAYNTCVYNRKAYDEEDAANKAAAEVEAKAATELGTEML